MASLLVLVTFTEATTEDILDPDLAEGLVALQPVLKDHKVSYSDPNSVSVRSDYVSGKDKDFSYYSVTLLEHCMSTM